MTIARLILFGALAALVGGCSPRTYEECQAEAAKNPSERGVTVGLRLCHEKFEAPRIAAEQAARKEAETARSERTATLWNSVQRAESLGPVEQLIGKADEKRPSRCAPVAGAADPPNRCVTHFWKDARTPAACASRMLDSNDIYGDGLCRWQVQTSENGTIWATWDKPF